MGWFYDIDLQCLIVVTFLFFTYLVVFTIIALDVCCYGLLAAIVMWFGLILYFRLQLFAGF